MGFPRRPSIWTVPRGAPGLQHAMFAIPALAALFFLAQIFAVPRTGGWTPLRALGLEKHPTVAIASTFGFHFDVYMALAGTLRGIAPVRVYRPNGEDEPFDRGFDDIVHQLPLYPGPYFDAKDLADDLQKNTDIGVVVLGTCEWDMFQFSRALLQAWDARPDGAKFDLVCVVHNREDVRWQPLITGWVARGAFRVLAISEHVAREFRHLFSAGADSSDANTRLAGYEYVQVDVHVPVLDLPGLLPAAQAAKDARRGLSRAVIQGHVDTDRRDYERVFDELVDSLWEDPRAWGYLPLSESDSDVYQPDPESAMEPFELHIAGAGEVDLPRELEGMTHFHSEINYDEFYRVVQQMDVVVPAFADYGYFTVQASSSAAMAAECNVPILATARFREAYSYLDDDRAVITRPQVLREVQALKALRTGKWDPTEANQRRRRDIPEPAQVTAPATPPPSEDKPADTPADEAAPEDEDDSSSEERDSEDEDEPPVEPEPVDALAGAPARSAVAAVHKMLARGWRRSPREFRVFKSALWARNRAVALRILRRQ